MKKIIIYFVFAFLSLPMIAQWQPYGPNSNLIVNEITPFNSELLIATKDSGVYISKNNIISWQKISTGLSQLSINSVISDNQGLLYAGTRSLVVNLSSDTGKTWTPVNMGGTGTEIKCLINHDNKVFAGQKNDGVFLTTNQGTSWNEMALCCDGVLCLCSDLSGTIYAGISGGEVYYSTSPYSNWNVFGSGFPNSQVFDLVFADGIIYAATQNNGIYKCVDGDSAWQAVNTGLPVFQSIAMAASGNKMFASLSGNGVFISVDKGEHWVNASDGLTNLNVISLTAFDGYLYAGTSGSGLWRRALSEMTSVEEISGADIFSVFPTIAEDKITIQSTTEGMKNIEIFNISGECVYKCGNKESLFFIDVSQLKKGMYIIQLNSGSEKQFQKFIKN